MPAKNRIRDPLARLLYADLDEGRDPVHTLVRFLKNARRDGYRVAENVVAAMRLAATGPEADLILPLVRALERAVAAIKNDQQVDRRIGDQQQR